MFKNNVVDRSFGDVSWWIELFCFAVDFKRYKHGPRFVNKLFTVKVVSWRSGCSGRVLVENVG